MKIFYFAYTLHVTRYIVLRLLPKTLFGYIFIIYIQNRICHAIQYNTYTAYIARLRGDPPVTKY